jgi:catechol 2,3-dioxygenase-like lactoylglutathione lyase family enzyme
MKLTNALVSHYDVHCDDLQEATRFYTDVLGFELLFATPEDDAAPLSLVWLRNSSGVVIELTKEKDGYDAAAANAASRVHLALQVDDLAGAYEWLTGNGVSFEVEPVEISLPGNSGDMRMMVSFFRGPANERFELLQILD